MQTIFKNKLSLSDALLVVALACSASVLRGSPVARVADGPTFPPAPWEELRVADGPTFPPAPWEELRVADGPTFPPAPWEELRVADGPTFPPAPWEEFCINS